MFCVRSVLAKRARLLEKFLGNPPSSSVDRANDLRFGKGRNRRVQI